MSHSNLWELPCQSVIDAGVWFKIEWNTSKLPVTTFQMKFHSTFEFRAFTLMLFLCLSFILCLYMSFNTLIHMHKQSGWQLKWRSTAKTQQHSVWITLNVCSIEKVKNYQLLTTIHIVYFFIGFISLCDCVWWLWVWEQNDTLFFVCSVVLLCVQSVYYILCWVSFCYGLSQSHIVLFRIYLVILIFFRLFIFKLNSVILCGGLLFVRVVGEPDLVK